MDIAGQASRSVRGLRLLGVEADLYAPVHPFHYDPPDIVPTGDRLALLRTILRAARSHDTFHFHFGASFHPRLRLLDAQALRAAGRTVVAEFHGSDVRMPSLEALRNPCYVPLPGEDDAGADRLMARWAKITGGHAICCDPSLMLFLSRHFDRIHLVGKRVEVDRYPVRAPSRSASGPLVVAHAPSDPDAKGTRSIRAAIDQLGSAVEYVEVTDRPHAEVMSTIERADLVVDHLGVASYGVLAIEAMSMAKPVICHLLPDYAEYLPADCPVIRAGPDTIADAIREWADRRDELYGLGIASRGYVQRNHDVKVVAGQLVDAYAELPAR